VKALIISAVAFAVLTVTAFVVSGGSSNRVHSVSGRATNVLSQKLREPPVPGVYQAAPSSGIVVVPKSVDSAAVHVSRTTNQFALRSIEPPLCLERKK
jgi:hypothetical protein